MRAARPRVGAGSAIAGANELANGHDRRAELRARIRGHARTPGPTLTAIPGLRFNRADRASVHMPNRVPALSFTVVAQGKKVCRVGDREIPYDADTYLVFTGEAEFTSAVLEATADRPYLSVSIQLPPEEVVRTLLSLGERPDRDALESEPAPAFAAPVEPPLVDALCRLIATLDDPAERQVIAPLVLSELVFRLLRSEAAATIRYAAARHGDQARIAQAMTFMRAHLSRRLSVASIARHVAMSPSHFAHRFREVARTSPMHYLKETRLLAARTSLIEGGCTPAEVATRVGYQSAAHFSRDFKSWFALPPAAYARQFRDRLAAADGRTRSNER